MCGVILSCIDTKDIKAACDKNKKIVYFNG